MRVGPCSVPECERTNIVAHGWCQFHYNRWRRFGGPLSNPKKLSNAERIKFLKDSLSYDGDDCLKLPNVHVGYGAIYFEGRRWTVSRLVCRMANGAPPTNKHEAAHSCGGGRRQCISKKHIRWKTPSENQMERVAHGTSNRGERHGLSKLTKKKVLYVLSRLKRGEAQASIASRLMVSQTAISEINTGKTWSWLTGIGS